MLEMCFKDANLLILLHMYDEYGIAVYIGEYNDLIIWQNILCMCRYGARGIAGDRSSKKRILILLLLLASFHNVIF